ncbi:cytochrome b/b6 domain-containing protein [uncultured Corynebacterium sp.]|uniref:cytochrome b/b6 domain-containing protein n=1 Tax=uncultured Corynebacterium sp. TaxID=159447 RepID=UPI002598F0A1|nr:cytochrome b/b6 domain-containing protein [uncultured Corynebacterium sp.]
MQVTLRRGLPRLVGGQPWPPEGTTAELDDAPSSAPAAEAAPASTPAPAGVVPVALRRGLPRVPGGEPFPPAVEALVEAPAAPAVAEAETTPAAAPVTGEDAANLVAVPVRRGLPRVPGGEPFPPAAEALVEAPAAAAAEAETAPVAQEHAEPAPAAPAKAAPESAASPAPARGGFPIARWLSGLVALGFIFGLSVLLARTFVASEAGAEFIARYDGTQPLPESAPVGLPAWLNWAHFFNMFLMALIVKTGLQVRRERRPEAYWASKRNPRQKISLTLWLHLALDLTWLALGAVFYVLLFSTGQWMRIVPTSWETIPNAISAGVQYLSMDWPEEHGWVHYNALQELTYFAVVFVASPIAAVSGLRMSPWWPKSWTFFPVKVARSLHFPTMIFFVAFIALHVFLVAATGLRRNLNAMFAARDAVDWTGTWFFLAAAAVIALAWWAARPAVVAPLARLTGKVSNR